MKIRDFLLKNEKKLGFLERKFIKDIYYPDYGETGLDLITPEVHISRNDHTNRKWRIDFVIKTKKNKFAIETDGYNYHAPGKVSKERFNELIRKQNECIRQGFTSIHLSRDQIVDKPEEGIYQLRRSINFDLELTSLFLKWNKKNKPQPHEIQTKALNLLKETRGKNKKRGLVALATGLGKTYLGIFDTLEMNSKRILFIVHQDHILTQAKNSFEKVVPDRINEMGFFTGKEKFTEYKNNKKINIIFSSIQLINRKKNLSLFKKNEFDYIIMDESHHTAAPSYVKVMDYFEPKFFLGLTATPERMDKKDVLKFYENNLVYEMDQSEAIRQGYLSKLNYKGLIDNIDYSQISYNGFKYDVKDLNKKLMIKKRDTEILNTYKKYCEKKKTIGFCASIDHADYCKKVFKEAGYNCISIHYESTRDITKTEQTLIEKFESGKYQIAFVVDMLNEGIDIPDVECILMLRPTESKTILKQQLGRGLRLSPETSKRELTVLDFIGNYKSSPQILESLGISNISDLKFDKEKEIYYFDNNGKRVEFDEEVVDIFKFFKSTSTKEIDFKLISENWKSYGNFVKDNTKKGVNLFWSIGKKNNHFEVHLDILKKININLSKFNKSSEIDKFIKAETKKKFPNKTMEGNRALFFSKILGLIKDTNPIVFSDVWQKILKLDKLKKKEELAKVLTQQLEKFVFWNDAFSLIDRHSGKRKVNEIFNIYPVYFIYQVIIKLNKLGFENNSLSKFELENFVFFATDHNNLDEVVEKIVLYRNSEQRYELEKFIKKFSRMDSRFYGILNYIYFFNYSKKSISIKNRFIDEVEKKVIKFNYLLEKNKIQYFQEKHPKRYKNILLSNGELLDLI